jgi:hypothetical protein
VWTIAGWSKIQKVAPDYMLMGERGMADMGEMQMPIPDNTAPMMTGTGQFGPLEMGGMFTVFKVRKDQKPGDYSDPGAYKFPAGTVAAPTSGTAPHPKAICPRAPQAVEVRGNFCRIAAATAVKVPVGQRHVALKKFPDMEHDEPNKISLAPGKQGEVIWQFTKADTINFACLHPGHFEAGMKGRVIVAAK